jgi:glycosyltransferase involved in cell wall biosynthesis
LIVLTPVDGAPLYPQWVSLLKGADGVLTISQFGVETMRQAGIAAELCRPGVDGNVFFPYSDARKTDLRARLNIAPDAFVLGSMCMNQGRKDIPAMLRAFFAFSADKPSARYLMDMEALSPAGWDIPAICQQNGWDAGKIIFRADAARVGLSLPERYNLLDAHAVIAHREGYGLPLAEAMCCGVVSIALDWCSGTEIAGDGKGILVQALDYTSVSTWGGALDKYADPVDLASKLQWLYDAPHERKAIAQRGMTWSRLQSWDAAADSVQKVIERVIEKRRAVTAPVTAPIPVIAPPASIPQTVDGMMKDVELVEVKG